MQILIGGVDKSALYRTNSLEIADEVNARSTCRFELVDITGAYHPANGEPVAIYDNDANLIFGGFVKEPEERVPLGTSALFISVDCVDNQAIADWRLIAESYDNMTTGDIVKDIIDGTLSHEGVWYNPFAVSLDGVNDHVRVNSNLGLTGYPFTLECWFKTNALGTVQSLISLNNSGSQYFELGISVNKIRIIARNTNTRSNTGGTVIAANTWNHAAVVFI
jgi:hypothetical protein